MNWSTVTDISIIGGIFITAWILIDRVFDYMFGNRRK